MPVLTVAGGKSAAWMQNASHALTAVLSNGRQRTLPGQSHDASATALAPVLSEFFARG